MWHHMRTTNSEVIQDNRFIHLSHHIGITTSEGNVEERFIQLLASYWDNILRI